MSFYIVTNSTGRVLRMLRSEGLPAAEDPNCCHEVAGMSGWPTEPFAGAELRFTDGALHWLDPRTTDEKAADARTQRDQLLRECDWTQGRDIADAVAVPWATYRNALRNLPEQAGFPNSITWPTPP